MSMQHCEPEQPKYHVPALEKGLDILEALASSPVPQTLADLTRTLNRTSSELFRMLTTLERRGYLEKEFSTGRYTLTLRLYELAHTHSPVDKLLNCARTPMRKLSDRIRKSCHLSILENDRLIVLTQADSPEKLRVSVEVGSTFSPVNTASGLLLLAYLSPVEFAHFCETNTEYQRLSSSGRKRLLATLKKVRAKGYSIREGDPYVGIRTISVLVGNHSISFTAALAVDSLLVAGGRELSRKMLDAALASAAEINSAIGLA